MTPKIGQRVRRTSPHPRIPLGLTGTIDVVHDNGSDFWVVTDDGGFNGWTSYDQWLPITTAEPQ